MKNEQSKEKEERFSHEKGPALLQCQENEPVKFLQLKIVREIVLGIVAVVVVWDSVQESEVALKYSCVVMDHTDSEKASVIKIVQEKALV